MTNGIYGSFSSSTKLKLCIILAAENTLLSHLVENAIDLR